MEFTLGFVVSTSTSSWARLMGNVGEQYWVKLLHKHQSNSRGEGRVGFLVWECLVDEVEFV